MARDAEEVDFRNDVEYRELPCRSLIAPLKSDRVPFHFSINPYRGCEFGCVYCYARYTHEFMEMDDWLDFERKIFIKQDAVDALRRDLSRLDLQGKWIAIGTATDPYQPAERRFKLTRSLLEVFARRRNLRLTVTTKSDLVARDVDLLAEISRQNEIEVNVTITTPDHLLARCIEPRAARPDRRLRAVEHLSKAGIRTGVFLMPLMPRINDGLDDIDRLARLSKEAGASYLASTVLFLRKSSKKRFFPFIEERFPELLPYYQRMYSSHRMELLTDYSRTKLAEVQIIKKRHGLGGLGRQWSETTHTPDQLTIYGIG